MFLRKSLTGAVGGLGVVMLLLAAGGGNARAGGRNRILVHRVYGPETYHYRYANRGRGSFTFGPSSKNDRLAKFDGTIECRYPGYRVESFSPIWAENVKPTDFSRRAATVRASFTADVLVLPWSERNRIERGCLHWLRRKMRYHYRRFKKYPTSFSHLMTANVAGTFRATCVRVKFPFKGRREKLSRRIERRGVRLRCEANPTLVARDEAVHLSLFWKSGKREDGAVMPLDETNRRARHHHWVKHFGTVWVHPNPGRVELRLYRNFANGDYLTTTVTNKNRPPTYRFIRSLGYVQSKKTPGTWPMWLYYHSRRHDFHLVGTEADRQRAYLAGYKFLSLIGYMLPPL